MPPTLTKYQIQPGTIMDIIILLGVWNFAVVIIYANVSISRCCLTSILKPPYNSLLLFYIKYSMIITSAGYRSDNELMKDTPYLVLMGRSYVSILEKNHLHKNNKSYLLSLL